MQKYLSDTREMVINGSYEEALKRTIWFHNHALEHEPAMYGVRLSFALSDWMELGEVYLPAKLALIATRDTKEKLLIAKEGDYHLFHDVVALNRVLGEDDKTIGLFEMLDKAEPEKAIEYWVIAKEAFISAKRYDFVRKYKVDFDLEFSRIKHIYELDVTNYDKPQFARKEFKEFNENLFLDDSLKLIEVALAINDTKTAIEVQQKALAILDDERLRNAISDFEGDSNKNTPF